MTPRESVIQTLNPIISESGSDSFESIQTRNPIYLMNLVISKNEENLLCEQLSASYLKTTCLAKENNALTINFLIYIVFLKTTNNHDS
jgi:hypothetical protein